MKLVSSILFLVLAFALPCFAQPTKIAPNRRKNHQPVVTAGGGATYLINQNFEGVGYDNSETWSEVGTPNEDYATSPAPLVGTQSLRMNTAGQRTTSPAFTAQDEIYWYYIINIVSLPATSAEFGTVSGPAVGVDIASDGTLRIGGAVNSPRTTAGMSAGSTYHIRVRYRKDLDGGGGSAIYSVEFSTTSTFTGSGNNYTQATTGTESAQATNVRFDISGTGAEYVIDKCLVDDVVINAP